MKKLINKIKCIFGFHAEYYTTYNTYYTIKCKRCKYRQNYLY